MKLVIDVLFGAALCALIVWMLWVLFVRLVEWWIKRQALENAETQRAIRKLEAVLKRVGTAIESRRGEVTGFVIKIPLDDDDGDPKEIEYTELPSNIQEVLLEPLDGDDGDNLEIAQK